MTGKQQKPPQTPRADVERACDELGWENLEWLEEWDGLAVADLRSVLDDEQYQALLDQLREQDLRTP